MNKEQRKLALMVKLNAVIPWNLFLKYNDCRKCVHDARCLRQTKKLSHVGLRVKTRVISGVYCEEWSGE